MPDYGPHERATIVAYDIPSSGWVVEMPARAPGRRWGPLPSTVSGLAVGDRVLLAQVGTSADEYVIIGRLPDSPPGIGDIPGLVEALDLKADDTDIVALDGRLDVVEPLVSGHTGALTALDGRLDVVEPLVSGHTSDIAALDGRLDVAEPSVAGHTLDIAELDGLLDVRTWDFRRVFPRRTFETVSVVCVGSSTTSGGGIVPEQTWVGRLGYILRGVDASPNLNASSLGGLHIRASDTVGWTSTGTITDNVTLDLGGRSRDMAAAATVSYTTAVPCDGFEVMYGQGSTSGALAIQIDGGTAINVTPQTTGTDRADGQTATYPTLSPSRGTHTVKVTATGRTVINGVYATDGDRSTGLRVYNAGKSGTWADHYSSAGASVWSNAARIAELQPRLIVFMIGSNDYQLGTDPVAYEAQVREGVRNFQMACNYPLSVLLVHSFKRFDVTAPAYAWGLYGAALKRIAADTPNVDFVDVSPHFPANRAADFEQILSTDDVHATARGHAIIAEVVGDHLKRTLTWRAAPATAAVAITAPDPSTLTNLISAWRATDLSALADGAAVTTWAAYAGSAQQPLAQTDVNRKPLLRKTSTTYANQLMVEFDGLGSTLGDALTCTFTSRINAPATVVVVARLRGNWGSAWSGYTPTTGGVYLALAAGAEMLGNLAAGTLSAPQAYSVVVGRGRWAVYVGRYDGANSALFQTRYPKQALTSMATNHANAGLPGLSLAAGSTGAAGCNKQEVSDVLVYSRALSDGECQGVLDYYARLYGFDGANRSSV